MSTKSEAQEELITELKHMCSELRGKVLQLIEHRDEWQRLCGIAADRCEKLKKDNNNLGTNFIEVMLELTKDCVKKDKQIKILEEILLNLCYDGD